LYQRKSCSIHTVCTSVNTGRNIYCAEQAFHVLGTVDLAEFPLYMACMWVYAFIVHDCLDTLLNIGNPLKKTWKYVLWFRLQTIPKRVLWDFCWCS